MDEGLGHWLRFCVCVFECIYVWTRAIAPRCTGHGWIPQLYAVHRETVKWQMKWHHFHPKAVRLSLFTSADCLGAALVFAFSCSDLCVFSASSPPQTAVIIRNYVRWIMCGSPTVITHTSYSDEKKHLSSLHSLLYSVYMGAMQKLSIAPVIDFKVNHIM